MSHLSGAASKAGQAPTTAAGVGDHQRAHIFRLREGKVVEFRGAPTDPYAFDELVG